jgi:hypothetical protein
MTIFAEFSVALIIIVAIKAASQGELLLTCRSCAVMAHVWFWFWYSRWVQYDGMNQNQTQKAFGFGLGTHP